MRSSAEPAAVGLADLAATLPVDQAAYMIGSAYAAILPQDVRARQGVFYTPPPLVERLMDQAAAARVDWATAHVLDPACGGGAFLGPVASRMCDALARCDRRVIVRNVTSRLRGIEIDGFAAWLSHVFLEATLYERLGGSRIDMTPCLEAASSSHPLREQTRSAPALCAHRKVTPPGAQETRAFLVEDASIGKAPHRH